MFRGLFSEKDQKYVLYFWVVAGRRRGRWGGHERFLNSPRLEPGGYVNPKEGFLDFHTVCEYLAN